MSSLYNKSNAKQAYNWKMQRLYPTLSVVLAGLGPILFFGWLAGGFTLSEISETRSLSLLEQSAQVFAGFMVKPLYSLLCLGLILLLWGQRGRDVASLRWGLVAFLTGETFCAVNFFVFQHESLLSEYLHSYGMALAFGLTVFAALEALDVHLLKRNQPGERCAFKGLCGPCKRNTDQGCMVHNGLLLSLAFAAILTFIPLTAPFAPSAYNASIYGFPYSYTRFALYEWYENRALPLLALTCFALALLTLLRNRESMPRWAKIFFSAGLGALGFSLLRLTLASIFREKLVWFEFWEEITELMYIVGVGLVVWQFKHLLEKNRLMRWLMEEIR